MDLNWKLTETPCNVCLATVQQLQQFFDEKVKFIQNEFNLKLFELNNTLTKIQQQLDSVVAKTSDRIKEEKVSDFIANSNHEFIGIKLESTYVLEPEGIGHEENDALGFSSASSATSDAESVPSIEINRKRRKKEATKFKFCKECNAQLTSRRQLVNHMVKIHGKERPFKCERCPKSFSDRYTFRKHSETLHRDKSIKRRYYCDMCPKILTTSHGLVVHKRVHTGEKPYECDICSNQYPQRNSLVHHMRTHTKERPYMCHECSKTFGQRNSFRLHLQSHRGIKPFKCEFEGCTWAFMQKSKLTIHIQSHTGERPVKCPICQKGYTKRYHVRKHIKNFHKIADVDGVLGPRKKPNQQNAVGQALAVAESAVQTKVIDVKVA